jgi:predicted ferric reductase
MLGKSIFEMFQIFHNNKTAINSYLQGKSVERFDDDGGVVLTDKDAKTARMAIGTFLVLFVVGLVIWIWALVVLIKYWRQLPIISQILGVIGLVLPPGPLLTLIAVYVGKNAR